MTDLRSMTVEELTAWCKDRGQPAFRGKQQEGFEGCLSLAGRYGIVKRPMKVKVKALDRHGDPVEYEREGITARCFCHEIEHLDGHMYYEKTDRLFTEEEVDELMRKAEEGE